MEPSAPHSTSKPGEQASTTGRPGDSAAPRRTPSATGERFRAPARLVGAHQKIERRRSVLILTGLSFLATCLIHPNAEVWWLAYVCLVPWFVAVCTSRRRGIMYFASWLLGVGYFFFNVRWMAPVTFPGYFALCMYYSLTFPLAAWPIRHMYIRHGMSVAVTAPIVWVALEYLRSLTAVSFPWVLLGYSQYKFVSLIQISDLVGAYGVSFVVAMINGWLTDLLIQPILIWRTDQGTRLPLGTLTTGIVVLGALIYGGAQASRKYFEEGPKVAVVQHDFTMHVDPDRASRTSMNSVLNSYLALARRAAQQRPDVILLPETPLNSVMNDEFLNASATDLAEIQQRRFPSPAFPAGFAANLQDWSRRARGEFQKLSDDFNVPILIGSLSMEWKPTVIPPRADAFNSAYLLMPHARQPAARYDKMHLVIFGEYVPFRYSHRWLYDWLNRVTPFGRAGIDYSLSEGTTPTVFEFPARSQGGRLYRAAAPICYEEIIPHVTRRFVHGSQDEQKRIDLLLSISNDGWFLHSSELRQHLAGAVFRAVEHRIAIARSVNTGVSSVIHPNGKIHAMIGLPPATQEALRPVAQTLTELDDLAAALEAKRPSQSGAGSVTADLVPLNKALRGTLRSQLTTAGPEFLYLSERLETLSIALNVTDETQRRAALARLRDQLAEDTQTLARWKVWPQTAPGYIVTNVQCDDRTTLYTRWGDWFGQAAVVLLGMMAMDWALRRLWEKAAAMRTTEGPSNATS